MNLQSSKNKNFAGKKENKKLINSTYSCSTEISFVLHANVAALIFTIQS